ncbi:hypothetical protein ACROYT_G034310 [Oculina patagonica]
MAEDMEDDLDLLACLVDSDSELLDDENLGEANSSSTCSSTSPQSTTMTSVTQSQTQQPREDGVQSGTTSNLTMEEMAAKMAAMQEQIKKLEEERNLLMSPTSANKRELSRYPKEEQEEQHLSKLGKQVGNKNGSNQDTSHQMQFSKNNRRIAHTPTQKNKPVSTESSTSFHRSTKSKSKGSKTTASHAPGHKSLTDGNMGTSTKKATNEVETRTRIAIDDNNFSKDRFSSLRIVNPLIPSVVMEKRMEGRRMVKISQIPTKIKGNNEIDGDWVTIGVIVHKMPPKKSSNGNTYGIWKLSDLGPDTANDCVVLFLFGDVYKEHWKTTEGSVVALLNASLLPAKEKFSQDLALTLDNPKKLMLMGISKDLGKCKGVKKSDNRPCTNFVNRQHGEFCEYHVQVAYKSMRAQRMECQAGFAPSAKAPLMKKFKKDLDSSTFMYQGRTVNASNRPTDQKKKNVTLKSLNIGNNNTTETTTKADSNGKQENKNKANAESSEFLVQLLALPTVGTRNLVRHLNQDEEQKKPEEERKPTLSASELLKAHEKDLKRITSRSTSTSVKPTTNSANDTPMLGRGLAPGSDLFFDESPNIKKRKSTDVDRAKIRALSLVKQNGPIEKEDPNAVRKKLSPKAQEQILKKAEDSGKENDEDNADQDSSRKKRRRILGPEFGSIDLSSEEGKKLLAAKSQHVGAVRAAEAEREEKYFNELEKKEQLEDKMKTITEIKVKVVFCKQCNYLAESASERCYKESHSLKWSKALKKFFACKDCKQRTISYGAPIPKHPCKQCGASNYQKTSMYKEKEGPKIGGETLLVRGEEHAKFLNSLE